MPAEPAEHPLVVAGMHRSGTSLAARLVQAAGVDLGEDLIPASESNPRGHFEDRAFVAFHERVLAARGRRGRALWRPPEQLAWTPLERAEAEALVRARSGGPAPWGWKDPRTTLFLECWRELLPGAVFLLVFREPAAVVDSLRRRGDRGLRLRLLGRSLGWKGRRIALFRYGRAIEAWRRYNARLLDFAQAHPERSVLVEIGTLRAQPQRVLASLRRLGLPLREVAARDVVDPALMSRRPQRRVARWLARRPEAAALYAKLVAEAAARGPH